MRNGVGVEERDGICDGCDTGVNLFNSSKQV